MQVFLGGFRPRSSSFCYVINFIALAYLRYIFYHRHCLCLLLILFFILCNFQPCTKNAETMLCILFSCNKQKHNTRMRQKKTKKKKQNIENSNFNIRCKCKTERKAVEYHVKHSENREKETLKKRDLYMLTQQSRAEESTYHIAHNTYRISAGTEKSNTEHRLWTSRASDRYRRRKAKNEEKKKTKNRHSNKFTVHSGTGKKNLCSVFCVHCIDEIYFTNKRRTKNKHEKEAKIYFLRLSPSFYLRNFLRLPMHKLTNIANLTMSVIMYD